MDQLIRMFAHLARHELDLSEVRKPGHASLQRNTLAVQALVK